jgi:hypothetical protein
MLMRLKTIENDLLEPTSSCALHDVHVPLMTYMGQAIKKEETKYFNLNGH